MVEQTSLAGLPGYEITAMIARREVSARDVIDSHIARLEAVQPRLNAVAWPMYEEARAAADEADAKQARGEALGPLHGVPISIKDQYYVAGTPTTMGLETRRDHRAKGDAPAVAKLRREGAIVVAKGNVPQLLMYQECDNSVYGRTNNPWDLERSPAGGTGGDAAIVAARGAALGLGSEYSGSIRNPAHACGIFGLKPTFGRMTMTGAPNIFFPGNSGIPLVPGMLSRNVRDLDLSMRLLSEADAQGGDPTIPPVPVWGPYESVKIRGLRVAMYTDDGYFTPSPAIRRAVKEAAAALRARGAVVEEFRPPSMAEAIDLTFAIMGADNGRWMSRALRGNKADPRISVFMRTGMIPTPLRRPAAAAMSLAGQKRLARVLRPLKDCSASEAFALMLKRDRFQADFQQAMDDGKFDAIICPVYPLPAVLHGSMYQLFISQCYSIVYNMLGMPAGAVSATKVRLGEESDRPKNRDMVDRAARKVEEGSAGMPVGVQVVGRHWREDVVLAVMAQLEEHFRAQPDFPARPPI
ncbi:MAG: amidase [Dehalococcoidia bacterium]